MKRVKPERVCINEKQQTKNSFNCYQQVNRFIKNQSEIKIKNPDPFCKIGHITIEYQYHTTLMFHNAIQIVTPQNQFDLLPPLFSSKLCGNVTEDIIFGESNDDPTKLFLQELNETFDSQVLSPNLLNVSSVHMHNMDGDNRLDVVTADGSYRHRPDELKASIHIFYLLSSWIYKEIPPNLSIDLLPNLHFWHVNLRDNYSADCKEYLRISNTSSTFLKYKDGSRINSQSSHSNLIDPAIISQQVTAIISIDK